MEICSLPETEFKRAVLKKLNELEENTDNSTKFNFSHEQIEKFNKK